MADVNVLIFAFRPESRGHAEYRKWLLRVVNGDQTYGLSDIVLSSFVRICTNPRIFATPNDLDAVLDFAKRLRDPPSCTQVRPGSRHWEIFTDLCRRADARGNLITDAYLAALAIENGCEWITTDRDYARFPGLRWRHPLD